jgi:transcriptional regulator with XRE-family HTH domain
MFPLTNVNAEEVALMLQITALRRQRRWSQAELARRAGLHNSTVCLIESARLRPYPRQLAALAAALEVPQGWEDDLLRDVGVNS